MSYILDHLLGRPTPAPDPDVEAQEAAEDDAVIAAHVATCTVDGFCYVCQCL